MTNNSKNLSFPLIDDYVNIFKKYGDPGEKYLRDIYPRICITKKLVLKDNKNLNTLNLLDIGAHWLHNSVLYAIDGISVTAADLVETYNDSNYFMIKNISREFNINLISYNNLSNPIELKNLPNDSFDIILFTEILEHITFNPVKMWEILYGLLKVGGKIVITTPNHHYLPNLLKYFSHIFCGYSAGITMEEIILLKTYGHHWKLYTIKDIKKYFELLSNDFYVKYFCYYTYHPLVSYSPLRLIKKIVENIYPPCKEAIYVEISIKEKKNGIIAKPGWWL